MALCAFLYVGKTESQKAHLRTKAEYSAAMKASAEEQARNEAKVRQIEQDLNKEISTIKKEYNAEIKDINAHRDALFSRLRNYQSSSNTLSSLPDVSNDTGTGNPTGRSEEPIVLREFGEEDIREAHRADTIRIKYNECVSAYGSVRDLLNK